MSKVTALARTHPRASIGIALVAAGLVIFGLVWFQPQKLFVNTTVSERLPAGGEAATVLAQGSFRGLEHDASGEASLVETGGRLIVRFEESFRTLNGPDLVVYLSEHDASSGAATFVRDFVLLGGLKGNRGSQNYEIPAGVDPSSYRSVVVWCRRFNVGFAVAPLRVA